MFGEDTDHGSRECAKQITLCNGKDVAWNENGDTNQGEGHRYQLTLFVFWHKHGLLTLPLLPSLRQTGAKPAGTKIIKYQFYLSDLFLQFHELY